MIINYQSNHITNGLAHVLAAIPLLATEYIARGKDNERFSSIGYYSSDAKMAHIGIALFNVIAMNIAFTGGMYALHKKGYIGAGTAMLITNSLLCASLLIFLVVGRLAYNKACKEAGEEMKEINQNSDVNAGNAATDLLYVDNNDLSNENFTTGDMIKREQMQSVIKDVTFMSFPVLWPLLLVTLLIDNALVKPLCTLYKANAQQENTNQSRQELV